MKLVENWGKVTWNYMKLHEVTWSYMKLHEVTWSFMKLHEVKDENWVKS